MDSKVEVKFGTIPKEDMDLIRNLEAGSRSMGVAKSSSDSYGSYSKGQIISDESEQELSTKD